MKKITDTTKPFWLALAIALFISVAPSFAGIPDNINPKQLNPLNGGNAIPANAKPKGYSLSAMAKATAAFNVTDHSGPFPDVVNGKPFQGLFTVYNNETGALKEFIVSEGTMLYVPVLLNDDSTPAIGTFPDVANRNALEYYVYSQSQFGLVEANITVDGKVTKLDHNYMVGVKVPPLTDYLPGGTPGTQYITVAAVLTPLNKGTHTVEISGSATGAQIKPWCDIINAYYSELLDIPDFVYCTTEITFSIPYTVIVQ
jgi:hypothetical protein